MALSEAVCIELSHVEFSGCGPPDRRCDQRSGVAQGPRYVDEGVREGVYVFGQERQLLRCLGPVGAVREHGDVVGRQGSLTHDGACDFRGRRGVVPARVFFHPARESQDMRWRVRAVRSLRCLDDAMHGQEMRRIRVRSRVLEHVQQALEDGGVQIRECTRAMRSGFQGVIDVQLGVLGPTSRLRVQCADGPKRASVEDVHRRSHGRCHSAAVFAHGISGALCVEGREAQSTVVCSDELHEMVVVCAFAQEGGQGGGRRWQGWDGRQPAVSAASAKLVEAQFWASGPFSFEMQSVATRARPFEVARGRQLGFRHPVGCPIIHGPPSSTVPLTESARRSCLCLEEPLSVYSAGRRLGQLALAGR